MTLQPSLPAASPEHPVPATENGSVSQPSAAASPNGKPFHPHHVPKARRGNRMWMFVAPAVALVFVLLMLGVWFSWFRGPTARTDLVTAKVEYKDLQLKVVERGALEAKENRDIKCDVKAGSRGAPKIKWVVDNGAFVKGTEGDAVVAATGMGGFDFKKPGDLLVEIDDSYIQDQATDKKIQRDNAEAAKIAAEQAYPVKKIAIGLAEQNLDKWIKGDYPQQLHDLEGQIQTSESNLLQEEDRTAWVARMVKKNYMTASQEEAERALLMGNKLDLEKKQELKKVLTDYTDPVNRQTFLNAITSAKNDERTAYSAMETARAVFLQQDAQYRDLLDQITQCKVYAPYSGIVVYTIPEQSRTGSGATQSIIAQGEPVQYGQKMLSIPDLSHMLVNVRVHEVFINYMRGDVVTHSGKQRQGLPATVRVDAVSGKTLKAHVKSVANVASPQDWMSPDVKVYQAYVEIDDDLSKLPKPLKPGLSAVCTIMTDELAEHVLAVPVQAILPPLEKGGKPRCFVLTATGTEPREIEKGMSDNIYVEIKSGLNEGEEVVLEPGKLLGDKEKKASTRQDEKIVPTGGRPGGGREGAPGGREGTPGSREGTPGGGGRGGIPGNTKGKDGQ